MLKSALFYYEKGLSIIPIGDNKKPICEWKEYQTKRADKEQIKKWFTNTNYNIGIVTGKISGITVIDIEEGGQWEHYPKTLTAKTGGNGIHLYYKYKEGLKNKVKIKELTDIRNDGGYVVAPPSVNNKGKYKWINTLEINDFPDVFKTTKKNKYPDFISWYMGVNEGSRNDNMIEYVGKIIPYIHPSDWEKIGWEVIKLANKQNKPPLTEKEIRTMFDDICEKEKINPSPRNTNYTKQEITIKPEDEEIMLMSEIAEKDTFEMDKTFPTGYIKIDNAMLGGFREGDLIIIGGKTGNGKTLMAISLTSNLVKSTPVLFFSYEVRVSMVWKQFQKIGLGKSSVIYSPFKTVTGKLDWVIKQIKKAKEKYDCKFIVIDHLGFLLPSVQSYNKSILSNQDAFLTSICRDLKTFAIQNDIIICVLAHLRKTDIPTIEDFKGSSGIAQESDFVFIVNRLKDESSEDIYGLESELTLVKNRIEGKSPKIVLNYENGKLIEKSELPEKIPEIDKEEKLRLNNLPF